MDLEDLQVTAQLAHLNLDEAELAAAFPAFEQMLSFFAAMQAADGDKDSFPSTGAESSAGETVDSGFFRGDNQPAINHQPSKLIDNAGERDGPFVVVPNVL